MRRGEDASLPDPVCVVAVAKWFKVPRCDRGIRGFESHQSPQKAFHRISSEEEHRLDKAETRFRNSHSIPDTRPCSSVGRADPL